MQVKSTNYSKKIVPIPRFTQDIDGFFPISALSGIFCDPQFKNEASFLVDNLPPLSNIPANINYSLPGNQTPGTIIFPYKRPGWFHKELEKYNLKITSMENSQDYLLLVTPQNILITALTASGIFNGLTSLLFLINQRDNEQQVPCMLINDGPRFPVRGISDDISRGQVSTPDHFKRLLRFMARYKMNVYMPYLEDMFRLKSFPAIGANRGALTAQECLELQDYAQKLHIEIIPVFQTLGHFENILIQPEFIHLAEYPGSSSLNPVSEQTYEFLETMLDEFLPVFRSVWINMGADESWDIGHGASRDKANKVGNARVHADHYRRVIDLIKKHDKKIMMYGDIILDYPDILEHLPRDIMIVDWHYDQKPFYASTELFRKSGNPFLVSPGTQSWSRIFPDLAHARDNISGMVRDGANNGAKGVITSAWGDFGGGNIRELNYYPFAWGADQAWNPGDRDVSEFDRLFFKDFYGAHIPEMAHIYQILSKCSDYYDLNHFFGNPFYPMQKEDGERFQEQSENLANSAKHLQAELKQIQSRITHNHEHADILQLCAIMYEWVGGLYKIRKQLIDLPPQPGNHQKEQLFNSVKKLINDLEQIKPIYKKIWLRYFKPDNLQRITSLMDRVSKQLQIKLGEMKKGDFTLSGQMPAPFISAAGATERKQSAILLQKHFSLEKTPQKAWLQVIAETHAIVRINGNDVGTVVAARTLSAIVEAQRVKYWPVEAYLKPGENNITLFVRNYKKDETAAANIWLECMTPNLVITSGDNWQGKAVAPEYKFNTEDVNEWNKAEPVANPWVISRPYLQQSLPSRIEFYRKHQFPG